ncbi:hypothetical protein GCM10010973_17570 [Cribrihabitans marinus]|nr:hypothetical protein GCM10010973_17570 [Cribrihabitans marinus]
MNAIPACASGVTKARRTGSGTAGETSENTRNTFVDPTSARSGTARKDVAASPAAPACKICRLFSPLCKSNNLCDSCTGSPAPRLRAFPLDTPEL